MKRVEMIAPTLFKAILKSLLTNIFLNNQQSLYSISCLSNNKFAVNYSSSSDNQQASTSSDWSPILAEAQRYAGVYSVRNIFLLRQLGKIQLVTLRPIF